MTISNRAELCSATSLALVSLRWPCASTPSPVRPLDRCTALVLQQDPFRSERYLQRFNNERMSLLDVGYAEDQGLLKMWDSLIHSALVATYASAQTCRSTGPEKELLGAPAVGEPLRAMLLQRNRVVRKLCAELAHERAARSAAEARDADKETFLGVLGHDLLSPLQAILTTADSMTIRGQLGTRDQTALARVKSSAARMQKMIEQLRDMARTREPSAFRVSKDGERDLTPLVAKVVHEVRSIRPDCSVDFDERTSCRAWVDGDRFEQVASNLIGNAVAHGEGPVTVVLEGTDSQISLAVHNFGPPIEPDQFPHLFEPFKRGHDGRRRNRSSGLGLGLYIADCIVRAHGGALRVTSSAELGTRFCAILPVH